MLGGIWIPGITGDLHLTEISSPRERAALEGGLYGILFYRSEILFPSPNALNPDSTPKEFLNPVLATLGL